MTAIGRAPIFDGMTGAFSRRTLLALVLGASASPRAFAQLAPIPATPAPTTIAIVADFPQLVVAVRIEGRRGWAVLDNGAPVSEADMAFANIGPRLVRPTDENPVLNAAASDALPAPGPRVRRIRLDTGLEIPTLWLGDLSGVSSAGDRPVSALIGMELFRDHLVDLDLTNKAMTLSPSGGAAAPDDVRALPLTPAASAKHLVDVSVEGGAPFKAVVDLGCSSPLVLAPALAERLGLVGMRTPTTHLASMGGEGGSRKDIVVRAGGLKTVHFAERDFNDAWFDVCDLPDGGQEAEALIGLPFLGRFDLKLDLGVNRMWLRDTPRLAAPFVRNLTGLQTEPADGGLKVIHVAAASPAEAAGFAMGDIIASIDGAPATRPGLQGVRESQSLAITLAGGAARSLKAARFY